MSTQIPHASQITSVFYLANLGNWHQAIIQAIFVAAIKFLDIVGAIVHADVPRAVIELIITETKMITDEKFRRKKFGDKLGTQVSKIFGSGQFSRSGNNLFLIFLFLCG